ncbi:hypothetical protein CDV55_101301 [Aspergillus turcosus]|uniref:Uncharacterized protein n=1 Tax=Aspergillus turcosus TaxID=1245748 RepID=A0A229YRG8_9EURO|nr:hypothetical protein CDV55_101301 [Aspergillus turcosus]RLM00201.1 hypothetical protein CFD26_101465 [Aspergillus turcosus]
MGIRQWGEQDERKARMQDAGLWIDRPNPYNIEAGLYIIVQLEYITGVHVTMDIIDDAYATVSARLESGQFRNPRRPIPGRNSVFIHYELINQDDGTENAFPTEEELFQEVQEYLMLMFDQLENGREFELPYKLGPVRVFWCDMVEWEPPTVTVEVFEETDSDSQEEAQRQTGAPTVTIQVFEQTDSGWREEAQRQAELPETTQN